MKVIQIIILTVRMHFELIQCLNDKIPNPCPVMLDSLDNPVADMCMSSIAIERNENGYEYLDSVVLRAMVDRDGCTCDVSLENQIVTTEIFIEKYKNMSAVAPENNVCGLVIDIKMMDAVSVYNPIECTHGVDRRPISIAKNGALRFTSRIIQGNFTRGYCISIIRGKVTNTIPQRLKIVCNESEILRFDTSSINQIDIIQDTNDSRKTMFMFIGASVGSLVIIIVCIIVILYRRQGCTIKEPLTIGNVNMQYDNLSESRNTSTYSTLDRPTIDDLQYEVVL